MPAFQGESIVPQAPAIQSQPAQPLQQSAPVANAPIAEPVVAAPVQPQFVAPVMPTAPTPVVPQAATTVATVAPAMMSINVEDAAIPSGTSPAVVALINEADRSRSRGDLDGSVVVLERALRIDSRNPTLTYKLAQLRLKQSKPQLAEDLAGKAALLAGSDLDLKRKSWLLIAEARQNQQNFQGAKDAKAKAESFFGR
jgi:predicted Zn-dependent protease